MHARLAAPIALFLICLSRPSAAQPYSLSLDLDVPLAGGLYAMKYHSGSLLAETRAAPRDLAGLRKSDIPGFDRWAIGLHSPRLSTLSSVLAGAGFLIPAAVNVWDTYRKEQPWHGVLVDAVILQEALMLSSSLSSYSKSVPMHATPLSYDDRVPESEKLRPQNASSFFSNHTTAAFTTAVFSAYTFQLRHSDSPLVPWVWGGSLALAGGVGSLRILAGKHFPSDVAAGAVVGALCGYLVPRMHLRRPAKAVGKKERGPAGEGVKWDLALAFPDDVDTPMPVVRMHF